jgi:type IV secretion system protein VirD4
MESLLASFSRMPAYDVTFWPFFQDFTQVRELYGHDMWETFIENAGVLQAFGHPRGFTAEYLSKLTGRVTVATRSTTDNTNPTTGIGTTRGETGRPARFPDEIARIDLFPEGPPKQLLFYAGKPFRITDRLRHFIDFPEYMRFIARQQSGQVRLIAE